MRWLYYILVGLSLTITSSVVHAGPSYEVVKENHFNSTWGSWSWNVGLGSSTSMFRGSSSLQVTFNQSWAGFAAGTWVDTNGDGRNDGFSTTGYKHLTFAVRNVSNGNDLRFSAVNASGTRGQTLTIANYTEYGFLPQEEWVWVRIPIADFGLGINPSISSFAIQSSKAGTIALDAVTFDASVTFFEGVRYVGAPGVFTQSWDASVGRIWENSSSFFQTFSPTKPWGGIQWQQRAGGITSADYGGLTIAFRKTRADQRIYVDLKNDSNLKVGTTVRIDDPAFIPDTIEPIQANVWYRVTIPLSRWYAGSFTIRGIAIVSDTAGGIIDVDDVRLVQKLSWAMKDYPRSPTPGSVFGSPWVSSCGGRIKLHNGVDYGDGLDEGRAIHATSRGWVVDVIHQTDQTGNSWGYAVIIQHEDRLITSSLHLTPTVSKGQEVQRGQLIGRTKRISGGSHLHLGTQLSNYESSRTSQTGALPQTACDGYPAFPWRFIDPQALIQ